MGALCYVPETKLQQEYSSLSLDEMQEIALNVLSEKTDEHADALYFKSGNSGGVRPKAIITDTDGHWLVKFRHNYYSLLQLTGYLTQSPEAVEQQFRRMAFNVYAHNMDDHARNFSFICREGKWSLAPAYDLTNDDTLGEHATTINFKGLPTGEDLITVGTNIRIPRARCLQIMEEVREGTSALNKYF